MKSNGYRVIGLALSSSSEFISVEYIPAIAGNPESHTIEVTERIPLKQVVDCMAKKLGISYELGEDENRTFIARFGEVEAIGHMEWTLLVNEERQNSMNSMVDPGGRVILYYGATNTSSTHKGNDTDLQKPLGFDLN
jgi:hypothetical protein